MKIELFSKFSAETAFFVRRWWFLLLLNIRGLHPWKNPRPFLVPVTRSCEVSRNTSFTQPLGYILQKFSLPDWMSFLELFIVFWNTYHFSYLLTCCINTKFLFRKYYSSCFWGRINELEEGPYKVCIINEFRGFWVLKNPFEQIRVLNITRLTAVARRCMIRPMMCVGVSGRLAIIFRKLLNGYEFSVLFFF